MASGMVRMNMGPPSGSNGAVISAPDVAASNGVIHVVDTVLMPAS